MKMFAVALQGQMVGQLGISVTSTIVCVVGYFFAKTVLLNLRSQRPKGDLLELMGKFTHVINMHETVDTCIQNLSTKSSSNSL